MRLTTVAIAVAALAGALALTLRHAGADPSGEDIVPVSNDRASAIAMTCANCHGTDGRLESTGIPSIAGKPEIVLRSQLLAFQRDEYPGATVMPRLVKGYTEEELAAVARYFAALKPTPEEPSQQP